jgi:hypothetical protein
MLDNRGAGLVRTSRHSGLCLSIVLLIFAMPRCLTAQEAGAVRETKDQQQKQPHESDRVAGIVPAFNVINDLNAPPLTSSQKFHLFTRTVKDPYNLIMPAVNAVILSSTGASSGFGSGFSGFAKRYAASIGDSVSSNFFRLYAFPALLHEDPRYVRAGQGSIGKRTAHVFAAAVWTRKDDKTFGFNWSKLLASGASAGLSNAYYPPENRGSKLTLERIGLSYLSEIGYDALKEFWPDIVRRKKK